MAFTFNNLCPYTAEGLGRPAEGCGASHHLSASSGANALLSPAYWRLVIVIHHAACLSLCPRIRWGDERLGGGRIRADKYVESRARCGLITLQTALCLAAHCQGASGGGGLSPSVACHSEDKHQLAATPVTPTLPSGVSRLHLRS